MSDDLLSVILPVYNQADHIERVVEEYEGALRGLPVSHETLLVVNGCRDTSLKRCQELAARHGSVRVLSCVQAGWGHAVKRGLGEARGRLLCYTNSARTSAQDLVLLVRYALTASGVVVKANRKIRESWVRRLGSLLYNLECRALFDLSCWDVNGTPKVFPRSLGKLLALTRDDDLLDAEFTVVCRREGYPMLEVPIFSTARHGGRSVTTLRSAVKLYAGALGLWRELGRRA